MNKDCEAEDSDAEFIVIPGGVFELEVQWLHEISTGYLCNNKGCSPKGQFYGFNTSWISTVDDGGWQFMCPICGSPCHVRTTSAHGLQAWAASAWAAPEEDTNVSLMKLLSEEDLKPWEEMPKSEVQAAVTSMVRNKSIPVHMTKMTLTSDIKEWVRAENFKRTKKWSYPMLEDGSTGVFYKVSADTPIMSEEDTKKFLACVEVLMDKE